MKKVGSASLVKEESLKPTWAQVSPVRLGKSALANGVRTAQLCLRQTPAPGPRPTAKRWGWRTVAKKSFLIPLAPLLTGDGQMPLKIQTFLFSYVTAHFYVDIFVLIWLKGEDVLHMRTWFALSLSDS